MSFRPIRCVVIQGNIRKNSDGRCKRVFLHGAAADVIFGIDVIRGKQSLMFGRLSLEELVCTGQCDVLGVVNVGLDQGAMGLNKLATLVQDIKGHHEEKT